jgi:hypothetical protein
MKRRTRYAIVLAGAAGAVVATSVASAQHHRGGHAAVSATGSQGTRVIAIPVVEAAAMMQRQRVWLFTAPAGNSAFGIGSLGEGGHRVWALLPSCRQPNPDDPRDPCPVGRVVMEVISGTGSVASTEPQTIGNAPDARRVQSFVIPQGIEQLRIKILRHSDEHVRYEAAVDAAQLHQLPVPEGQPRGPDTFVFTLAHYPSL